MKTSNESGLLKVRNSSGLSAGLEDYLEIIYNLTLEKRLARVKDISERMHVSGPSVSGALKTLKEKGAIDYEPYGPIFLTKSGETWAREIVKKHQTIFRFLNKTLGVEKDRAEATACSLEHFLDNDIRDRLLAFLERIDSKEPAS